MTSVYVLAAPSKYSWAELMRRVWELDVLELPSLSGADEDCGDHLFFRGDRKNLGLDGAARAPPLAPACPNSHSTFDDFSRLACL